MKRFVIKFKISDISLVEAENKEKAKKIFMDNIKFSSGTIEIENIYEYSSIVA